MGMLTEVGLTPELAERLYRGMVLIREFETRVQELFSAGELPGFVHLYIGQEAIAVGACADLRPDDYITSTHRGHGHLLAKGGDPRRMMAELYGKATGYCKGKGGSMHIADPSLGILGANGLVADGLPIAVGAGFSAKTRGTDQVAIAFFGDGASNEGAFHEALNLAAAYQLPVLFVCENNLYAVSTRLTRVTRSASIADRAAGYGMPGMTIDGNDILAVYRACSAAIRQARAGEGPTLIECKTYRQRAHFEGEVDLYRPSSEVEEWKTRDPIERFRQYILSHALLPADKLDVISLAIRQEIDRAVEFARQSPLPRPEDALMDVYA
jgi:TPP-dependent pyruvate/acetoin dehydrogenase alpha subunit